MNNNHPLRLALKECRPLLWGAFWCGLFINLLMLAVPIYSLQVLDRVLSSGSFDTLLMLTIVVAAAVVFMGVMQGLRSMVFSHLGRWMDDRLSGDIVDKMVALAVHKPKIGSQPLRDLATVRGFVTSPHLANFFDAPWAVIYFTVIYIIHPTLGLIVTGGAIVLLVFAFVAHKLPSGASASANDEQIKSVQAMDAILRNAEVVKSMGLLPKAKSRWQSHNEAWLGQSFSAANISTTIAQITRTLRLGLQIGVTGVGAWLALSSEMSPGAIIAISILTGRALAPFDAATPLYQSFIGVKKALTRLFELDQVNDLICQTMVLPEPKGALTIHKATYEVAETKRWILRGVNIELEAGSSLGIIGPSGSGKTTLARLLAGVMLPTTGAIRLDGAALYQWDPTQLGETIGYLPQAVELFNGTIAENIARLDRQAPDEQVIEAAQNAQVHQTITAFPNGYQTDIGLNGSLLSAGQRQRIALARCFYGNPKLIIMDEPNANLDTEGEMALVNALDKARELGITTVTIAHRPSILQNVDMILVLQDGEAKLFGPANEVMEELAAHNKKVQPISKGRRSTPKGGTPS